MKTSETVNYRANIRATLDGTTKLRWPHNFGAYRLADHDMAAGSLLGSPKALICMKPSGAIEQVYCVDAGMSLIGTFLLRHWDEKTGIKLEPASGHYFLFPQHQEHKFMLSNGVYVREDVFVLASGERDGEPDPPLVYYAVEYANDAAEEQRIATYAFCEFGQGPDDTIVSQYDPSLRAIVAWSRDCKERARIFGASRKPDEYELSIDHAKAVTARAPSTLSGETGECRGFSTGIMRFTTRLAPGDRGELIFTLGVSASGSEEVRRIYACAPAAREALDATERNYHTVLGRSVAMTPNPEINRGVLWAKANMERVMQKAPTGWGFTNDPSNSTHGVGRDAAWFCAGADYFRPDFSRACLLQFFERQKPNGMMVEYYDLLDGSTEDFGLNINDNTPLLVWSAWHHYQTSGDGNFLDAIFDRAVKAGRYILQQRNDDGLVWCTSKETGSRGIVGWRNVIPNYRLSGAVTEINAECFAALRSIARLAKTRGDDAIADEFEEHAQRLRADVNRHLINPGNGLYYLNIEVDGTKRTDITADLIIPVIFGLPDEETAARIIRRLSDRDFWTPGGMRTIPHDAIDYSPDGASGCLGGVWNGVTFWFAKAAASYIPDFTEEALTNGFENYARNPQRNNTVPGQFSEWLHGQTLVNEGMLLSPWFPPRYVWAVIEGAIGLDVSGDRPRISPNLASDWHWCGLRNVPYRGERLTFCAAKAPELHAWSTGPIDASFPVEVFDEDWSERTQASGDDVIAAGFRSDERIVALAGNTTDRTADTALRIQEVRGRYAVREFDSLRGRWADRDEADASALATGIPAIVEPKGFHLLELRRIG